MEGGRSLFWEVPVDPAGLDGLVRLVSDEGSGRSEAGERAKNEAVELLGQLISAGLTERQARLVDLYFFEGRTQEEIAAELGVSQQAVSRQLFGVLRKGRRVGGAIQRLRKLCLDHGIDPETWV
jgi:DNA-directed RNA polymerase specialized sigma24 family protein